MPSDEKRFDALYKILARCKEEEVEQFIGYLREAGRELMRDDDLSMYFHAPLSELVEKARARADGLGEGVLSQGKPKPPKGAEKKEEPTRKTPKPLRR